MFFRDRFYKCFRYVTDSDYRYAINGSKFNMYHDIPDKEYLQRVFRGRMGYDLDLDNPRTFNEKLQWLKLHDRRTEYVTMVDKYEVKTYIEERIGKNYIIPTLGVWNHFSEIDFDKLPDQFVLKCTHDSGGLSICTNKKTWNRAEACAKIEKSLKRNYYYSAREWPYKNVKPRILAEKYLNVSTTNEKNELAFNNKLIEYKLFCFYGKPKWFLVSMGAPHGEGRFNDFYDMDFNHIPVSVTHPNAPFKISKPPEYNELIAISEKLSIGIPHLRVDTYVVNGHIYVGELTFFHAAGFCHFNPIKYDQIFGEVLRLPKIKKI